MMKEKERRREGEIERAKAGWGPDLPEKRGKPGMSEQGGVVVVSNIMLERRCGVFFSTTMDECAGAKEVVRLVLLEQ